MYTVHHNKYHVTYEVVIYSCYCLFDVNDVVVVVFGVSVVVELLVCYCYVIVCGRCTTTIFRVAQSY